MVLKTLEELYEKAKSVKEPKRLAIASPENDHTIEAVLQARDEGFITPILIGNREKIVEIADKFSKEINPEHIISAETEKMSATIAVQLVREKKADFIMKGKLNTSIMARAVVDKETGIMKGSLLSNVTICEIPTYHKLLAVSDGGITLNPTLENKKGIIENAVSAFHNLGYDLPKVAVLTALEEVNPKMQETVDAAELKRMNQEGDLKNCLIEGPISMDIATDAEKAKIKGFKSEVAGDPDILIWPSLVAGNIALKTLIRFAGAKTISFSVGAQVPIIMTSRSGSTENKYESILAALSLIL